jgi:ATP-binding cassette subfamily B protein
MDERNKVKAVFSFYLRHYKAYPKYLACLLLFVPTAVLLNGILPQLVLANVIGRISQHKYVPHEVWQSFGPQLLLYMGLLVGGMLAWRLVDYFAWRLEGRVTKDIAEGVLDYMLIQSTDFHANNFSGSLVSNANKLHSAYIRLTDTSLFQVYPMIIGIISAAIILLPRAPLFVAILLVFSAFFIAASFQISKPVRKFGAETAANESRETGFLADAITNVVAIKSFARGDYERRRFAKATAATNRSLMRLAGSSQRQMNSLGTISRLMSGASLLLAVVGVLVFDINVATVFLIFTYTSTIADQLFNFGNQSLRNYNRSIGDTYEFIVTLSREPAVTDPEKPEKSRIKAGAVDFRNVVFDHDNKQSRNGSSLFNNFNLNIKPGEKIGLVGHSGGGKTTLTKLILRFMNVDGGEILIDGQNIARLMQDDLRRSITYVPQEPLLFHRTLAENICYGKPEAVRKEIIKAAKLAHAHEFISELPDKYDTLVGERGVKLSGGQRQRIAIARAMLKDAPILVLDEATSALDSESEKLIQDALWKLMEGRTAIVIAHRLSTIQRMDRIVVLEDGNIAEEGDHKELLAKKGVYALLWAHQSGGFLEE